MKAKFFTSIFNRTIFSVLFLSSFFIVKAQNDPAWLMESWRTTQYPPSTFITGFAQDSKNKSETIAEATERVKNFARANLSESILASVKSINESYSQSILEGKKESVSETFKSQINISTDIEINGIKLETFVKENIVYGFAFANKYEIIGFYKANLNMQVQQIEGYISTALELERNNEKNKAKEEFNKVVPVFDQIATSQGILSAVDKNISDEDLKMKQTMQFYNEVVQANARLAQGIVVFITTNEDLFNEKTYSIENNLKAILAANGCRFTKLEEEADWKVEIMATTREFNYSNNVYFSYVDAVVKLFKAPTDKHVFQDELSQKGAHSKSYRDAARKAYEEISNPISEKILTWINN